MENKFIQKRDIEVITWDSILLSYLNHLLKVFAALLPSEVQQWMCSLFAIFLCYAAFECSMLVQRNVAGGVVSIVVLTIFIGFIIWQIFLVLSIVPTKIQSMNDDVNIDNKYQSMVDDPKSIHQEIVETSLAPLPQKILDRSDNSFDKEAHDFSYASSNSPMQQIHSSNKTIQLYELSDSDDGTGSDELSYLRRYALDTDSADSEYDDDDDREEIDEDDEKEQSYDYNNKKDSPISNQNVHPMRSFPNNENERNINIMYSNFG